MEKTHMQRLVLASMLASLSGVIKIMFQVTTLSDYRFSLYEIPLIIAGIVLGPGFGAVSGFASDWIYSTNFGYGFNLMTVSSVMWGFIPGLLLHRRHFSLLRTMIVIIITAIVSFSINSVQLGLWFGWLAMLGNVPIRLGILIISLPIQGYLVHHMYHRVVIPSGYLEGIEMRKHKPIEEQ